MIKNLYVFMLGLLLVAFPSIAQAQDSYFGVRVEPGVAVPVGEPQEDRFDPGFALAIKPEFSVMDIFSFGPSAAVVAFTSELANVDVPTILGLGGFVRVKRPHGYEWNPDEGVAAVSPWADADLQYVRTGPLDRFGYTAAVGAAWPVEDTRMLWIGPMVRYQGVHQDGGLIGRNTNDSHTVIFGVSFEINEAHKKAVVAEPQPEPVKPEPVKPVTPKPTHEDVNMELHQVIQFAWDSDKLDSLATGQLDNVLKKIGEAKSFKAIRIEGHASSEGQVKHNEKLAQRRANSVMNYLANNGIPRDKLSAVGHGPHKPVANNSTEAGRVANRRAEFVVNFVIVREVKK